MGEGKKNPTATKPMLLGRRWAQELWRKVPAFGLSEAYKDGA